MCVGIGVDQATVVVESEDEWRQNTPTCTVAFLGIGVVMFKVRHRRRLGGADSDSESSLRPSCTPTTKEMDSWRSVVMTIMNEVQTA